jgi:hypothetical protein
VINLTEVEDSETTTKTAKNQFEQANHDLQINSNRQDYLQAILCTCIFRLLDTAMVSELLLECKHFLDLVQHGGKRQLT